MAEQKKNPEVWAKVAMADHFEKIQKLKDPIEGVPNFRRVPGYKIYCCGQPTKDGFKKACEKVIPWAFKGVSISVTRLGDF